MNQSHEITCISLKPQPRLLWVEGYFNSSELNKPSSLTLYSVNIESRTLNKFT